MTGHAASRRLSMGDPAEVTRTRLLFMSTPPPPAPGPGGVGRRIEEAVELIEMELRHAIGYVNDAVIPQVRRESILAMRSVADTLRNLADRIEHHPPKGPQP